MTEQQENQDVYKKRLSLVTAMSNIESKEKDIKSSQGYFKAYLWSMLIPPIGIFYFIKYAFFTEGQKGSFRAGIISLLLTLISFFLTIWMTAEFIKQSTSIIPSGNLQMINDLALPANQKKLLDLFK